MFRIDIDASRSFVSIEVRGQMDDAEAALYVSSIRSEFVSKIGARPYVMLIDTSKCVLHSQSVVERFRAHIGRFPKATRIALVTGDSLVKMQLRRVLTRDYSCFFATVDEALPWLLHQWPPAGRAAARPAPTTVAR